MRRSLLSTFIIAALAWLYCAAAQSQEVRDRFMASPNEFINSCASCHGEDGRGAGFMVKLFRGVDPGDLTQLSKSYGGVFPFERIFEVIDGRKEIAAHGDRKMPVWGDRYMAETMTRLGPGPMSELVVRNRVLELVYYIQSIQEL